MIRFTNLPIVIGVLSTIFVANAFQAPISSSTKAASSMSLSQLHMAPRFDKNLNKWVATKPDEEPEAGYGIGKTLLLRGPKPFFHRVFQPGDYEQAVLKFMAIEKVDRIEAQGNMDAYLENAQDWAFNRFEEQRTGFKRDYTKIDQQQLILTLAWSAVVAVVSSRVVYSLTTGEYFWSFLKGN